MKQEILTSKRKTIRESVTEGFSRARGYMLRGDSVKCPCCGGTFRGFMYSPYLTARCPHCESYERYRLLCLYLRDELDFCSRDVKLLDIGPIRCFQKYCRSLDCVQYTSVDIASPLADYHMDIRDLDFRDETFDCIICYHVLEHIPDDHNALQELYRVLKPEGWAIIQVPLDEEKDDTVERSSIPPEMWRDVLKWPDHLRIYGKDFSQRLVSAGFKVKVSRYVDRFTDDEIAYYGLDPDEDIYVCYK